MNNNNNNKALHCPQNQLVGSEQAVGGSADLTSSIFPLKAELMLENAVVAFRLA